VTRVKNRKNRNIGRKVRNLDPRAVTYNQRKGTRRGKKEKRGRKQATSSEGVGSWRGDDWAFKKAWGSAKRLRGYGHAIGVGEGKSPEGRTKPWEVW